MNTSRIIRAQAFERALNKKAQPRAEMYFQRDPKTNRYRGIVEHVDEAGRINFLPEKPLVGNNLSGLKTKLQALVNLPLNDKGVGEPWHAESNMPFDAQGNRVG